MVSVDGKDRRDLFFINISHRMKIGLLSKSRASDLVPTSYFYKVDFSSSRGASYAA